jgi:hypothetical protein
MAYFQTKNPNLGKFLWVVRWKMLVYFMTIWSILLSIGIFCRHLVYVVAIWYLLWLFGIFLVIWYIFPVFGTLYQEKSGNPANRTADPIL